MRSFFSIDGPLFSFLSRMADLLWLNVLFIVFSLPIVTVGASTTAMYYVCLKMVRDEDCYITKSFWKSFKENFKQATVIWLILGVILAVLLIDLRILYGGFSIELLMNNPSVNKVLLTAVLIVGICLSFILVYVFPTLAQFENTIKNTVKNALLLSIKHLPITVVLVVIMLVPVIWFLFPESLITIIIMFSLQAYVASYFLVKVFAPYMPEKEEEATVNEEDIDYSILGARPIEDKTESDS